MRRGMAVRFAGASGGCGAVLRKTIGMRSALLCAYSAEELFIIGQCRAVCGPPGIAFSRVGFGTNSPSQSLTALPDSPFCRYATSVPLFVTCGDISPRRGENLSRPGEVCLPEGGFGSAESFSSSPEAPSQRELSPEVTEGVSLHQRAQQPQHTVQHRAGQAGAAFRHLYLAALRQRGPYIVPQNCHLTVLLQQYTALKV